MCLDRRAQPAELAGCPQTPEIVSWLCKWENFHGLHLPTKSLSSDGATCLARVWDASSAFQLYMLLSNHHHSVTLFSDSPKSLLASISDQHFFRVMPSTLPWIWQNVHGSICKPTSGCHRTHLSAKRSTGEKKSEQQTVRRAMSSFGYLSPYWYVTVHLFLGHFYQKVSICITSRTMPVQDFAPSRSK